MKPQIAVKQQAPEECRSTASRRAELRKDIRDLRQSPVGYEGPTDERLARAGFAAGVESFHDPIGIGADGKPTAATVIRRRARMQDDGLEWLAARCLLCPGDKFKNSILKDAAEWYRQLHRNGGGEPLKAQDPAKPFLGGSGSSSYFRTDWQIDQFAKWVEAREQITSAFQTTVDNFVLFDQSLAEVGHKVSSQKGAKAAAVALEFLRLGIEDLAIHRGTVERRR